MVWSPDSKTLASVGRDKESRKELQGRTIRLHEAATGKEVRRLTHEEWVNSVAWYPDGKTLASSSRSRTIRLLDPATGREVRRFATPEGLVLVVASVLFLAVLSRFSWPRLVPFGQGATDDCGSYNEAIQVAQDAARDYLLASDVETVALDDDITATLFKRTGIWTVKGFAASENSRKFRWVVILAYHPGGVSGDHWELVTVVTRSMERDSREFSRHSRRPSAQLSKRLSFVPNEQKGGSNFG